MSHRSDILTNDEQLHHAGRDDRTPEWRQAHTAVELKIAAQQYPKKQVPTMSDFIRQHLPNRG